MDVQLSCSSSIISMVVEEDVRVFSKTVHVNTNHHWLVRVEENRHSRAQDRNAPTTRSFSAC